MRIYKITVYDDVLDKTISAEITQTQLDQAYDFHGLDGITEMVSQCEYELDKQYLDKKNKENE